MKTKSYDAVSRVCRLRSGHLCTHGSGRFHENAFDCPDCIFWAVWSKIVLDRNFAGMNEETTDGTLSQEEEDPEAEENETASEDTENADAKEQ